MLMTLSDAGADKISIGSSWIWPCKYKIGRPVSSKSAQRTRVYQLGIRREAGEPLRQQVVVRGDNK